MRANAGHVGHDALGLVGDRQPVDELAFGRAGAVADIVEAALAECGGLEAACEQAAHDFVGEELHAAVRVMNDEPFSGAEELVRNDERADCVIARPSARVTNDVGVAFAEARVLCRVQARIHARQNREPPSRREGQAALLAKVGGVRVVGGEDFIEN